MSENYKLINLSYIEQVCGGNKEMVSKMVDLFVEQTPLQLKQLKSAAADGRWSDFFAVAHKTKSSMAMMGVKSLQEKLVKLESYSKHKTNLHEVDDLLSEVDTACTKILKEISTIQVAANK